MLNWMSMLASPEAADQVRIAAQARDLVRDLHIPEPRIYWADLLVTAAVGWIAFAAAVLFRAWSWQMLSALLVCICAFYRGLCFLHEISHIRAGILRGFEVAWNILFGIHKIDTERILMTISIVNHALIGLMMAGIPLNAQVVLRFDVASVKPSDPGSLNVPTRADTLPGGRLIVRNAPLKSLLVIAYGVTDKTLVGAPSWCDDHYDIDAVAEGQGELTTEQLREPLKALLVERMGLITHEEAKEVLTFSLRVAPGGTKLQSSVSQGQLASKFTGTNIDVHNATMANVAYMLSRHPEVQRLVTDDTGLSGQFDLQLEWSTRPAGDKSLGADKDPAASIFTLVQERLGLVLAPIKKMETLVVIDKASKPAAN